jgi:uncharacterized repeat protein (TIGR01451 family)
MKRIIISTLVVAAVYAALAAQTTNAQYGCNGQYGQYGGCTPTQNITINKLVGKETPDKYGNKCENVPDYVENLSSTDPKFIAGNVVCFKLNVTNPSTVTLNNVKVVDYVPAYLEPVEGPGNYDSNSRQITFTIPQLQPNETKTNYVKMQVIDQSKLNAVNDGMCEYNKASAATESAYNEDRAQFCVDKQVIGVTQVPSTGPEDWLPTLLASVSALGAGVYLKRKYN